MKDTLKYITEAGPFYLATVENNKPKVRPFGFVMEYQDKLYFCTGNQKDIYRQLQANPYFEVCTMGKDRSWVRLKGKAVFDKSLDAKAKVFEVSPGLLNRYKGETDPIFEIFYIEDGEATFYSFTSEPRTVKL